MPMFLDVHRCEVERRAKSIKMAEGWISLPVMEPVTGPRFAPEGHRAVVYFLAQSGGILRPAKPQDVEIMQQWDSAFGQFPMSAFGE